MLFKSSISGMNIWSEKKLEKLTDMHNNSVKRNLANALTRKLVGAFRAGDIQDNVAATRDFRLIFEPSKFGNVGRGDGA